MLSAAAKFFLGFFFNSTMLCVCVLLPFTYTYITYMLAFLSFAPQSVDDAAVVVVVDDVVCMLQANHSLRALPFEDFFVLFHFFFCILGKILF